ncbi:AAA family ATPase [Candidatus Pacearchaeota archaeon]|nr:AAA family ATPase [Candidatus Pacearchaeota archaeon]
MITDETNSKEATCREPWFRQNMTNILSFVSIKGGVGKTTLALETATSLAKNFNKKVLLVDANFSAPNIGLYLDLTSDYNLQDSLNGNTTLQNTIYEAHGIDIIPSALHYHKEIDPYKLKSLLQKYKSRYDFIILDTSPNYEELRPIIAASDKIFLVSSPDHVTLHTTLKAAKLAQEQKTPIHGIIVNKIRSPKHEYNLQEIEKISNIPVLARIHEHKEMARSLHKKTPLSILAPRHQISREIENFASAIAGHTKKEKWFYKFIPYEPFVPKEEVNRQFYKAQL